MSSFLLTPLGVLTCAFIIVLGFLTLVIPTWSYVAHGPRKRVFFRVLSLFLFFLVGTLGLLMFFLTQEKARQLDFFQSQPLPPQSISPEDLPPGMTPALMVQQLRDRLEEEQSTNLQEWLRLGRSYLVLDDLEGAHVAYKTARMLDPTNDDIGALYGMTLFRSKQTPEAIEEAFDLFQDILQRNPDHLLTLIQGGFLASFTGDTSLARLLWSRAISLMTPGDPHRVDLQKFLDQL